MANIPNTEYITVTNAGVFIGEKPATHYRGQELFAPKALVEHFKAIQARYPNIAELRMLSSETDGESYKSGNPVAKHGPNMWCCVEFFDGVVSPWVLTGKNSDKDFTARRVPCHCLATFRNSDPCLQHILGPYKDAIIKVNLQNMAGKSFELNGYKITIEKMTQPQNER